MEIDGNLAALRAYERKVDRFEKLEAMWEKETEDLFNQIQEIADQYRAIARHFEDEYGFDADWREDIENAIGR